MGLFCYTFAAVCTICVVCTYGRQGSRAAAAHGVSRVRDACHVPQVGPPHHLTIRTFLKSHVCTSPSCSIPACVAAQHITLTGADAAATASLSLSVSLSLSRDTTVCMSARPQAATAPQTLSSHLLPHGKHISVTLSCCLSARLHLRWANFTVAPA